MCVYSFISHTPYSHTPKPRGRPEREVAYPVLRGRLHLQWSHVSPARHQLPGHTHQDQEINCLSFLSLLRVQDLVLQPQTAREKVSDFYFYNFGDIIFKTTLLLPYSNKLSLQVLVNKILNLGTFMLLHSVLFDFSYEWNKDCSVLHCDMNCCFNSLPTGVW